MPIHKTKINSKYTTKQLFDLVVDIEKYPEFLPWCAGAKILSQDNNVIYADLMIKFKIFSGKYTSKVSYKAPKLDDLSAMISVELVEGPFTHLYNKWQFIPIDTGSMVYFDLDFGFTSSILNHFISGMFQKAAEKMVLAFNMRALQLYS
ncbi:Oligoketide cyclase/lipid transport protein [Rickettsiales bacterium Ac37b]|nr:Oligoketide cyclase/lipid transport protein [Rickettsiales bacterium Ac37b]